MRTLLPLALALTMVDMKSIPFMSGVRFSYTKPNSRELWHCVLHLTFYSARFCYNIYIKEVIAVIAGVRAHDSGEGTGSCHAADGAAGEGVAAADEHAAALCLSTRSSPRHSMLWQC